MKDKVFKIVAVLLSVVFLVGSILAVNAFKITQTKLKFNKVDVQKVTGTTYFVDAASKEGNDGLTEKTALKTLDEVNELDLKPGDQVLFKKDCRWSGGLVIKNSGTSIEPIYYGAYGEGHNMPIIAGDGEAYAAIYGVDVSYITINGLEITNEDDETTYLRGIFINALEKDVEGIKITNNYIHDVDSDWRTPSARGFYNIGAAWTDFHWIGGIIVRAGGYAVKDTPEEEQVILNNILVEGNTVEQVAVDGITVGSITKHWKKSTGVIIRNNTVNRASGDGILMFACEGGIIEGNVCDQNGWSGPLKEDMNFVGIFIIYCDNTLMQYNSVTNQHYCTDDGQGYDVDDTCTNTIIQYNYSANNANGFLLLFNYNKNGNVIVRYNISQNDAGPFVTVACKDSEYPMTITGEIYNNTCFTNKTITEMIEIAPNSDMRKAINKRIVLNIYNNIFYNAASDNLSLLNNDTYYSYFNFSNNCWVGISERTLPENEEGQLYLDPKLCYPGYETADGYQLLKDSPCIGAGIPMFNDGGLDFFGNELNETVVNIGAYSGNGVNKLKNTNLALNQTADMANVGAIAMLKKATLAKLVDGDKSEVVYTKACESAKQEEWFLIDLGEENKVNEVVLYAGKTPENFPKTFEIQVFDGKDWKKVDGAKNYKTPKADSKHKFSFKTVKATKVRVLVKEMYENSDGKYTAGISEIEVYERSK